MKFRNSPGDLAITSLGGYSRYTPIPRAPHEVTNEVRPVSRCAFLGCSVWCGASPPTSPRVNGPEQPLQPPLRRSPPTKKSSPVARRKAIKKSLWWEALPRCAKKSLWWVALPQRSSPASRSLSRPSQATSSPLKLKPVTRSTSSSPRSRTRKVSLPTSNA